MEKSILDVSPIGCREYMNMDMQTKTIYWIYFSDIDMEDRVFTSNRRIEFTEEQLNYLITVINWIKYKKSFRKKIVDFCRKVYNKVTFRKLRDKIAKRKRENQLAKELNAFDEFSHTLIRDESI